MSATHASDKESSVQVTRVKQAERGKTANGRSAPAMTTDSSQEEETETVNKYIKNHSPSLAVKEMPIKTSVKCHIKAAKLAKLRCMITRLVWWDSEHMHRLGRSLAMS